MSVISLAPNFAQVVEVLLIFHFNVIEIARPGLGLDLRIVVGLGLDLRIVVGLELGRLGLGIRAFQIAIPLELGVDRRSRGSGVLAILFAGGLVCSPVEEVACIAAIRLILVLGCCFASLGLERDSRGGSGDDGNDD